MYLKWELHAICFTKIYNIGFLISNFSAWWRFKVFAICLYLSFRIDWKLKMLAYFSKGELTSPLSDVYIEMTWFLEVLKTFCSCQFQWNAISRHFQESVCFHVFGVHCLHILAWRFPSPHKPVFNFLNSSFILLPPYAAL